MAQNGKIAISKANEIVLSGYLDVPQDGDYTFSLSTSGKALLRLHEAIVIDADFGYHADSTASGTIKLKAGKHPFHLACLKIGDATPTLDLKWNTLDTAPQDFPLNAWSH